MRQPLREPNDPRFTPVMLRRELLAQGWTDQALRRLVAQGTWVRARQGAYVDAEAWSRCDEGGRHEIRARAVLKQANAEMVISHRTGAQLWDLSTYDHQWGEVDVTRRDGRAGRAEAGVRQHRGVLLDTDTTVRHGVPVVTATRLGLELPTVLGMEQSFCYVGELLHRGDTTIEALVDRYAAMREWPHSLNTEILLRLAHGECESVGEFRTDFLCWKQSLPAPLRQFEIRDRSGTVVARTDFAWPEYGVFLEFDGRVKYQRHLRAGETVTDAVLREKRREELISELTGWTCPRLVWADLYQPEHTALRIKSKLFRSPTAA